MRPFADQGAHVIVTGRRQAALDALASEFDDRVTVVRADVSSPSDVAALYEVVASRGPGPGALHANAGVGELGSLVDVTAVATMTRMWAAELAPRGIRINTVVPGPTETPGLKGLSPNDPDGLVKQIAAGLPFGRLLRPEEIAAAVLFRVSTESSGMTGSEVFVDGGSTIA